jgi:hypothetical protein
MLNRLFASMNQSSLATVALLLLLSCIGGCDAGSTGSPTAGSSDSGLSGEDAQAGEDAPAADSGEALSDTTEATDGSGGADTISEDPTEEPSVAAPPLAE